MNPIPNSTKKCKSKESSLRKLRRPSPTSQILTSTSSYYRYSPCKKTTTFTSIMPSCSQKVKIWHRSSLCTWLKISTPSKHLKYTRFHKKYKFVFLNNLVDNKQVYYELKNIFLTFPIEYFLSLEEFIFVKPSFSQKFSQLWTSG